MNKTLVEILNDTANQVVVVAQEITPTNQPLVRDENGRLVPYSLRETMAQLEREQ